MYIQIFNYKEFKTNLMVEMLGKFNLLEKEVPTLRDGDLGLVLILDGYDELSKA